MAQKTIQIRFNKASFIINYSLNCVEKLTVPIIIFFEKTTDFKRKTVKPPKIKFTVVFEYHALNHKIFHDLTRSYTPKLNCLKLQQNIN